MKDEERKLVDHVMDWFDFARITEMMEAVGFGWAKHNPNFCEGELRKFTRERIMEDYVRFLASGRKKTACYSGGIRVIWDSNEDRTCLTVEAVLESESFCTEIKEE